MVARTVVLVSVGNDCTRFDVHMPVAPPLGILALGSYLERHGVPVELIDVQMDFGFGSVEGAERVLCERVAQYLAERAKAIAWIGISMLSNSDAGLVLGETIRRVLPEVPIVYGGYFPSRISKLLLENYPFMTAIVRGDGEAAALHISRCLANGRPFPSARVPNLVWRERGEIRTTPRKAMRLGRLPNLNYRLLHNARCYPAVFTMLSRGCPFRCAYCSESSMRSYAAASLPWIARQLDHLQKELGCTHIGILDPIFGVGRRRTRDILKLMRGRGLSYALESRVDVLPPDLIPELRDAGVKLIFWGLESGSARTLRRMNKLSSIAKAESYLDDARAVLRACMENDIVSLLGLMFGYPGDTRADCQATLRFAAEISRLAAEVARQTGERPGFVPFATPTIVYDGTPLARAAAVKQRGVTLQREPFLGESSIRSASPGLRLREIQRYASAVSIFGSFTPNALAQLDRFSTFAPKKFAAAHPELTDTQGVTVVSSAVRRLG